MSLQQFKDEYPVDSTGAVSRSRLTVLARPSEQSNQKFQKPKEQMGSITVEFYGGQTVGIKELRAFVERISQGNHSSGIFISPTMPSPAARKIIPVAAGMGIKLECFEEPDLMINITHHELVPQHFKLSDEERLALLERYRVKQTQLPRIQTSDPMARYLGLQRGDVVKIVRKSETAGRYASYRAVM